MAFFIQAGLSSGSIDPLSKETSHYNSIHGGNPHAFETYGNNPPLVGFDIDGIGSFSSSSVSGSSVPTPGLTTGSYFIQATQHSDFRNRIHVIPSILQLSNPQLNSGIPFKIWNTGSGHETITAISTPGSSVLSFDLSVGDILYDNEYRTVNLQIDGGEAVIETIAEFETTSFLAYLPISALVSDTFNLIPDVPVRETWEFKTTILSSWNGTEQRMCLRRYPRVKQEFTVEIVNMRQRREQYNVLRKNISVQSLVPMYQYGVNLSASSGAGENRIYFDSSRTNMREGESIIVVNGTTEQVFIGTIEEVHSDGVTVKSSLGFEVGPSWVAAPSLNCIVKDNSGLSMNNVTGSLKIEANTFSEPVLVRPDATITADEFDDLPWINRRPLIPADETFTFRRDIIDNSTGTRSINPLDLHPKVSGDRKFTIQRNTDPGEMDYWRSFFDKIRGSQKSFLLATWFSDLTPVENQGSLSGKSSFLVNESYYPSLYHLYDSWSRIQVEFQGGEITQHVVTSGVATVDGYAELFVSPSLPSGTSYESISKISFLQRWRATDRVVLKHYANYSEISFGVISSDE